MSTIRYKKRYNKWYVYEITQYWDKNLKKPRQKSKYLGVADEKDGVYAKRASHKEPSSKVIDQEKCIVDFGDSYSIHEVSKSINLIDILDESFENSDSIMALSCFQIIEGSALYNCEEWFMGNIARYLFKGAKIKSPDISRLIKHLGRQDLQVTFFKKYIEKFFPNKTGVLIDSTALANSINCSLNAFGYANGSIEKNVSCLMLVDSNSKLPIYFRAISGDIADVSTVQTTMEEIKKLGLEASSAILDAGFCSKENLQFLFKQNINFVTRLPKSHKVFSTFVHNAASIETSHHAVQYGERIVFIKSTKENLYDCNLYVHVVLDPCKKGKDIKTIFQNQLTEELNEDDQKTLDEKMKSAGYFILLSKDPIEKKDILPTYYTRQSIEQVFGFAKSHTNILPLRVHFDDAIRGYIMFIFITLILYITMRQRIKTPTDQALITLRNLKAKVFDNNLIVQETTKKCKDIAKNLNIIMPTTLRI